MMWETPEGRLICPECQRKGRADRFYTLSTTERCGPCVLCGASERWHGTLGGYTNHRCRCEPCRRAWAEYHRGYRARSSTPTRKVVAVTETTRNEATPGEPGASLSPSTGRSP